MDPSFANSPPRSTLLGSLLTWQTLALALLAGLFLYLFPEFFSVPSHHSPVPGVLLVIIVAVGLGVGVYEDVRRAFAK